MNVFKPKGRSCYYVFFRHRGRQILRSCGKTDYSEAKQRAVTILAEAVTPPTVSAVLTGAPTQPAKVLTADQIGIEEICGHYDIWLRIAKPGQKRPREETAKGYQRRLRQLAELLDADTVQALSDKLCGLTPEKLGVSEGNFTTLIRNAAAVFGKAARAYYATQNMNLSDPFGGALPAAPERPLFAAPSKSEVAALVQRASDELEETHPREWCLFLLALGAGLRVQEISHLKWSEVTQGGISVSSSKGHKTKSGRGRFVPCGTGLLEQLERYRGLPGNFVISDGRGRHPANDKVPRVRCSRAARRLSRWLRNNGIPGRNPIHALRKVFGSFVANEHGVFVTSRYLGHGSVAVTEACYAGLIGGGPKVEVI